MSRAKITSPKEIRQLLAGAWVTREEAHALEAQVDRNVCRVCGMRIRMQIRRGTGLCSARCETGELEEQEAKALYATEASAREAGR